MKKNANWTSIKEENMELDIDKYMLLPYKGQRSSAATSLGLELYYGAKPKQMQRENSESLRISTVSNLSKKFCYWAIVSCERFIEEHKVLVSDSRSLINKNCVQLVALMVVACRVHFEDEQVDSLVQLRINKPSVAMNKPSCGHRFGRRTYLLVKWGQFQKRAQKP